MAAGKVKKRCRTSAYDESKTRVAGRRLERKSRGASPALTRSTKRPGGHAMIGGKKAGLRLEKIRTMTDRTSRTFQDPEKCKAKCWAGNAVGKWGRRTE